MRLFYFVLILFFPVHNYLPLTRTALAEAPIISVAKDTDAPIEIKSDSMSLDSENRIFTYTDNVVVVQDNLTIEADELKGYYTEASEISRLIASGNVKIRQGDSLESESGKAEFLNEDRIVILTQSPKVFQGTSVLEARKIKLFLDTEKTEAEDNVRVRIVKEGEKKKRSSKKKDKNESDNKKKKEDTK